MCDQNEYKYDPKHVWILALAAKYSTNINLVESFKLPKESWRLKIEILTLVKKFARLRRRIFFRYIHPNENGRRSIFNDQWKNGQIVK